jgi:hypothetical protein
VKGSSYPIDRFNGEVGPDTAFNVAQVLGAWQAGASGEFRLRELHCFTKFLDLLRVEWNAGYIGISAEDG